MTAPTLALPAPTETMWNRFRFAWLQMPWEGMMLYGPNAGLALPAAYASAQFAQHGGVFPAALGWMIGISFEWMYIGSLALASRLRDSKLFNLVNALAVLTSIVYVTLFAADAYGSLGTLMNLKYMIGTVEVAPFKWFFAVVHAAPLAGLNYLYSRMLHQHGLQGQSENVPQVNHKVKDLEAMIAQLKAQLEEQVTTTAKLAHNFQNTLRETIEKTIVERDAIHAQERDLLVLQFQQAQAEGNKKLDDFKATILPQFQRMRAMLEAKAQGQPSQLQAPLTPPAVQPASSTTKLICQCGREFDTPSQMAGHRPHCKARNKP